MININLEDTTLYKILQSRSGEDQVAAVLTGLTILMTGDAANFLEFVKTSHPEYTSHNIQHSWRILNKIGKILRKETLEKLTSVEIFSINHQPRPEDVV